MSQIRICVADCALRAFADLHRSKKSAKIRVLDLRHLRTVYIRTGISLAT